MSFLTIEEQGKTVEDAIESALKRLNASRGEVEIEVLDEGSTGLLNLVRGRPARVKVTVRREEVQATDAFSAEEWLRAVLLTMGFDEMTISGKQEGEYLSFELSSPNREDTGLLIGRDGENINALQHLLSKVINRDQAEKTFVVLDTEDYRARRIESLEREAENLARKVKKSGRPVLSDMLNPHDRRIIHMKLSEDGQVETNSIGEGFYKQIKVSITGQSNVAAQSSRGPSQPQGNSPGGAAPRRRRR